ncbi:energy transducer TonB, partial [Haematobacter massiliensis]|uniref:energy transducer TonB n=2 Tax=Haematobacter massiliensis TaxID=195105 RepID=UPI0023F416F1
AKTAETRQEAVRADASAPPKEAREAQEATAPEEATTRVVTEATEVAEEAAAPKPAAPASAAPPRNRPEKPKPEMKPVETAAVEPEKKPQPPKPVSKPDAPKETRKEPPKPAEPAREPPKKDAPKEPRKAETPKPAASDAIADAVAAAVAGGASSASGSGTGGRGTAPSGPPMTSGEKDALRVAVQACWNVGSLSSEAQNVTVTLGVKMAQTGIPEGGSVRMIGYEGGSETAARQAYEAARRAILRCGAKGFPLPTEKYEQWRDIEMVFNPESMRIK